MFAGLAQAPKVELVRQLTNPDQTQASETASTYANKIAYLLDGSCNLLQQNFQGGARTAP